MDMLSRRLGAPRGLLILFGTVVALPAAALVFLGVRLLQQDRDLARQRRAETLQQASDRAVRALGDDLAALQRRLSDPSSFPAQSPPGSAYVLITRDQVSVAPAGAVAYYPMARPLKEPPASPFVELEAAEFKAQDLSKALEIGRRMAGSADPLVRAGALLRQARILRKMGRSTDALATYDTLAASTTIAINGTPADLQARRMRCVLLLELGRTGEQRQEAVGLDADLGAGRWQLDPVGYQYVSSQLDQWLGSTRRPHAESERLAAAVVWLYHEWTVTPGGNWGSAGARSLAVDGASVTAVWGSAGRSLMAFIGGPRHVEGAWLAMARKAAEPAEVSILPATDSGASRSPVAADSLAVRRSAADTGLPWTLFVTLSGEVDAARFESRRRMLLGGLVAVLVLVAAGSYFVVRSRNREIVVARLQSDFVAAVSHEFRTPLTALRQFNQLLADQDDVAPEKRRAYYQAQTRATERLHRLVESLLDFGRMEAGKRPYTLQRIDAGALVSDVVQEFNRDLDRRSFDVRCVIEPGEHRVDADAEALALAIWNLLDNAVKYSGDRRQIDVSVRRDIVHVLVIVRDHGLGIPAADQRRIFQKFVRLAGATSRGIKGSGIGLAMVQHIVAAHGGTVRVSSVEGEGSTFTIVLPEQADRADRMAKPDSVSHPEAS
jgi:two-component system phosphate regulon sensor histidine kinase PhoR